MCDPTRQNKFGSLQSSEQKPNHDHVINNSDISYFAETNARAKYTPFGIKQADRLSHIYAIGKTGVGKTTLLETLISQDIQAGRGCALIDPHGDFVERLVDNIPEHRRDDVVYLNVADPKQPYGYNPLMRVSFELRPLVASGLMDVLKKMWADAWGVRMEHILRNAVLALLDQPSAILPDVLLMIADKNFRYHAIKNIEIEQVEKFWSNEFPKYSYRYQADGIAPIQNKIGAFLADPRMHKILTRRDGQLRLRSLMDAGKILLVNLSKGRIGEDTSSLFGGMVVTSLGLAAFSRVNVRESERRAFYVYVDEFQNFTTLSLANMLSELRKFGVGVVLAHQYLHQLDPDIREAVIGNAGTLISFRLGASDAGFIAREFEPIFAPVDLLNLPNRDIYLKLMIDGAPSKPFSATTLQVDQKPTSEEQSG
jgi:hypothetical protein